jgi:hypothetical protein
MASTENLIVRQAKATQRIKDALGSDLPQNKGPALLRHTLDLEAIAAALESQKGGAAKNTERKD